MLLDIEEDHKIFLILGRPFLATSEALIDVNYGKLTPRVNDDEVTFSVFHDMKSPIEQSTCLRVDFIDNCIVDSYKDGMREF